MQASEPLEVFRRARAGRSRAACDARTGVAQSNARVSAFMRNVEASKWITAPKLSVISSMKAKTQQEQLARTNDFTLLVNQTGSGIEEDLAGEAGQKKPAAKGRKAASRAKGSAKK